MSKASPWSWWRTGSLLFLVCLLGAAVAVALPRHAASAPGWTTPVDISHNAYSTYDPELVIDAQGFTHAVWWGNGETDTDRAIWYTNNRSGSWATPRTISPQSDQRGASIAIAPSGEIDVVYEDFPVGQIISIYSTDSGQTWSPRHNISHTPAKAHEPGMTIDPAGNVHAAWIDSRWLGSPNYQVTYARRSGTTWGDPVWVQSKQPFNKSPKVTTTGTGADMRIHLAYYGKYAADAPDSAYEAYASRGTGDAWEHWTNVSHSSTASLDSAVTESGTTLFYAWDENERPANPNYYHDILFSISADNGSTWSAPLYVTHDDALDRLPSIEFAQGKVQLAFEAYDVGNGDIAYYTYDPATGQLSERLNLSSSSNESAATAIAASETQISAAWQEKLGSKKIIMTSGKQGGTPPPTATPTNTPVPSPTPDPRPYGYVEIVAEDPAGSADYTHQLPVDLHLSATSPSGSPLEMRIDNFADFHAHPDWIPFASVFNGWSLAGSTSGCERKPVYVQYRDTAVPPNESPVVTDDILFDGSVLAALQLNGGQDYANQLGVTINSEDLEAAASCSGIAQMSAWEEGLTQTGWITFTPALPFTLATSENPTHTIYVSYRDYAGNEGTLSDTILIDTAAPYSGTAPIVNGGQPAEGQLVVPVSGLQAFDDESGVAHIWLANRADGPWFVAPYCANPPCTVDWNLGFGGPPIQAPEVQTIYLRYEDNTGYGAIPGNLSLVFTDTITVTGIFNDFLPLVPR